MTGQRGSATVGSFAASVRAKAGTPPFCEVFHRTNVALTHHDQLAPCPVISHLRERRTTPAESPECAFSLIFPSLAGLVHVLTAMNPHPTTTRRAFPLPRDTRSSSWPREPLQGEIGRFSVIARDASQDLGDWGRARTSEKVGRAAATATTGHREGAPGQATTGQYRNGRSPGSEDPRAQLLVREGVSCFMT